MSAKTTMQNIINTVRRGISGFLAVAMIAGSINVPVYAEAEMLPAETAASSVGGVYEDIPPADNIAPVLNEAPAEGGDVIYDDATPLVMPEEQTYIQEQPEIIYETVPAEEGQTVYEEPQVQEEKAELYYTNVEQEAVKNGTSPVVSVYISRDGYFASDNYAWTEVLDKETADSYLASLNEYLRMNTANEAVEMTGVFPVMVSIINQNGEDIVQQENYHVRMLFKDAEEMAGKRLFRYANNACTWEELPFSVYEMAAEEEYPSIEFDSTGLSVFLFTEEAPQEIAPVQEVQGEGGSGAQAGTEATEPTAPAAENPSTEGETNTSSETQAAQDPSAEEEAVKDPEAESKETESEASETEEETDKEKEAEKDTEEDTEKDTETDAEKEESVEKEETEEETQEEKTYTFEDEDVVITAVVKDQNVIKEGAKFVCSKIAMDSERFDEIKAKLVEYYGTEEGTIELVPYDIGFRYEEEKIEPENGTVSVSFALKTPMEVAPEEKVDVVHMDEQGSIDVLVEDAGNGKSFSEVSFDTGSFSDFVVVKTQSAPAKAPLLGATGDEAPVAPVGRYISKTPNIDNNGNKTTNYSHSANQHEVITVPGAKYMDVTIEYGGESINYDWACMWEGNHPSYTAYNNWKTSMTQKLGGSHGKKTFRVNGDSATFAFRSDGSGVGDGYGYFAVVTPYIELESNVPEYHFEELEDGTYALVFDKGGDIQAFINRSDVVENIAPYKNKISEIRLHKDTTSVSDGAFMGLSSLKTVTFPRNSSLTTIGDSAFADCDNLESFNIPATVTSVSGTAFLGCKSLESVTFAPGNTMTTLPNGLFSGLAALKNVTLPSGLTKVPDSCFYNCTALRSIDLPETVTALGTNAFRNTGLTEVPSLDNITTINSYAFAFCPNLKKVTIPATVTTLGNGFEGCSGITDFIFEDGSPITSIGGWFFSGMTSLTNVKLPDGLTAINKRCFQNCTSLEHVELPANVKSIAEEAFLGCTNLKDFEIPSGIKSIGTHAFQNCRSLKDMVIPKTVTSIGTGLFEGCSGLIRCQFEPDSPIKTLPGSMFYGCSKLEFVRLPDGVTAIPASYFRDCTSLRHVDLPADLKSIGDYAFYNCYNLEQIDLPNQLTTIGQQAFYNCDKITDVVIPASVKTLGNSVWQNCDGLKSAVWEDGNTMTTLSTGLFYNCTNLTTLVLPKNLSYIPDTLAYNCPKLRHVDIPPRITRVGSSSFYGCTSLDDVVLPATCTQIYSNAFYNAGLTHIELPANLTSIGSSAFNGTKIKEVTIPNKVTTVDNSAFRYCSKLEKVTFEEGGVNCRIGEYTFADDYALQEVNLKEKINRIDRYAFQNDKRLEEVVIPSTVTQMGGYVYNNDIGIKTLEFPPSASNAVLKIDSSNNGRTFGRLNSVEEILIDRNITSDYKNTTNFFEVNPNAHYTIGSHVDTLDNIFISNFTDKTKVTFVGENDFSVSTRIANESNDLKWSEFKGDFYVDPDGVVYKLNKTAKTASVFYIPDNLTAYTVPATVTSVAGVEYTVNMVDSYACKSADSLTELTFEKPDQVTIPQFAFSKCPTLTSINGKDELYPEEWVEVSLLCDFPIHTDAEQEQVKTLRDSLPIGEAGADGVQPIFSFGVSMSNQERMEEDGLTYVYPTGRSARLDFAISNESNIDMSSRVIRVYFAFDGDNYTMGNYPPGDYTLVNDATGSRYPFKVRATNAKGVYYYDITGFNPGDTLAFNNQMAYNSPTSGGGTLTVWVESLSAEEAAEKEGKTSQPNKYMLAEWYTTPTPYNLTKQFNGNPSFQFVANSSDENDENIYIRNMNYQVKLTSGGASGNSYAKDYIQYVDFYDDLKLNENMIWNPDIVEAVRNGDYFLDSSYRLQAIVDGKQVLVCTFGFNNGEYVRNVTPEIVTDDNGNDAIRLHWSYRNQYWSNPKTAPTADMPATTYNLSFGERAVQVKEGSPLWDMFRNGVEYTEAESTLMRHINNVVDEVTHYSYSEDQTNHASAPERLVGMTNGFTMNKTMSGSTNFGQPHGFTINMNNTGLIHKDDIDHVEDTLRNHYYISGADMTTLFNNSKWGPYARVDVTSATLCSLPDKEVVDVYGNPVTINTAEESGVEPVPYNGCAPAGSDASVITASAKLSLYWNSEYNKIVLEVKNDAGEVQNTYLIGEDGDYPDIQSALDGIGYLVTMPATYKVTWNLGDNYTLYKAAADGVSVSDVSELTPEQLLKYEYRLKSGRTDSFYIPSRIKDTTMWLTEDKAGRYTTGSISSNNYAYVRDETGRQVGTASWSGYIYSELQLTKGARANGTNYSANMKIPDDTVVDYTLSFTNSGEKFEVLPLNDRMRGAQVLLIPVRGNKAAMYYAEGAEGVALEDSVVEIYMDGGIQYYVLDKPGTYKGVTIDGRIADTIKVAIGQGTADTQMTWYYQDVMGYSANASSVTNSITYKALADSSRLGEKAEDASGSTVTKNALQNESWLGGHQTHRLYASLAGESEQVQFSKRIVENPGAAHETLIGHSLVEDGDSVLYKMVIKNSGEAEAVIRGSRLYDQLPSTSGVFAWSKENVKNIYYVTENLGSSVENPESEHWQITSIQPGTGADTASRGLYYILWDNDFAIHLDGKGEVWIYVEVQFPGSDDVDEHGEPSNAWDDFIARNNGGIITNYFYIDQRSSSVTHELVDVVEGTLQKGVLDTGLSTSGKFQSEDTRQYYQNGGNLDNGSVQEVSYYTLVYNSGNVRLYLDKLQDQLPKGFKFRNVFSCVPNGARTSSNYSTNSSTVGNYGTNTSVSYLEGYSTSSYFPVATVKDGTKTITYKNASVSAAVDTDSEGHQQVQFTLARSSNSDSYLRYDSALGKYYLNPGEAVRFGYTVTVEGYDRTENVADNEIAMPMYDKYGLGIRLSDPEEVVVTPAKYRDIAVNDGECTLTTNDEEENGKKHYRPSWAKGTTEWLSSHVSLQRLEPVPGILKTVGGETYLPSTTVIQPDSVYGTLYTSGSKTGTPYTGTVARTSIVNWLMRIYNEGGVGSNSMEDFTIVDTVDAPYMFTGNFFYDYYTVGGTKMSSSGNSVPVFSLGGRTANDTTVPISTGQGNNATTLNGTITVNGAPVSVDGGRATVQLLRDEFGVETIKIRMKDNYHRIPPNAYMALVGHTQYVSTDAVLSKQFYNHVQLEPSDEFDPALVSQGKVLYRQEEDEMIPYAIESGASVTMTAGYSSAARKQVTEMGKTSNTGWSDQDKNYVELPEKYSRFYYDLYVDLPKDDPTQKIVIIDALPEEGDHSPFVERDMRDSQFMVHITGDNPGFQVWSSPNLGTGAKTELTAARYSLEVTTRREFEAEDWDGNGTGWTAIDQTDGISAEEAELISNARSFRIIVDDPEILDHPETAIMGKNYQLQIRFNAELAHPEDADPGTKAWNSFGYRYTVPIGATGFSTSLNAEPLKVGVLIPSVPYVIKDQKTPHNHYKSIDTDTTYRFLIYSGTALPGLNDITGMSESDIYDVISAAGREFTVTTLDISSGTATGQTDYLDEAKKWTCDGTSFIETADHWIWVNGAKYSVLELPWTENGFTFSNILHSPVNNYTFSQNSSNNVVLRVTNVWNEKGRIKLQKNVTGPNFDPERRFTFTIKLKDGRHPVYGSYEYTGTNMRDGTLTFDDTGTASIQLKHNQAIEILDIPAGYTYEITESADAWYESECTTGNASGSVTTDVTHEVSFTNTRKESELSITKTVEGNFGSKYKLFDFEVYITDEGKELNGTYTAKITHDDDTVTNMDATFEEGATILHLKHGDKATIYGLPIGVRYEVDELAASRVGYTTTSTNDHGYLPEGETISAWTNTLRGYVNTAVETDDIGRICILAAAVVLGSLVVKKKRKKIVRK